MAKKFIYPDPNMYDSGAVRGGAITGGDTKTWVENSSAISNVDRVADQNIGSVISNVAQYDTIRIDMGSGFSCDAIAFYHTAAEDNDLEIYASNSASTFETNDPGNDDHIASITANFTGAWQVTDITVTSKRYLYIYNGTAAEWDYCSEIMVGTAYTFGQSFDLGNKQGKIHGVDVVESYGGYEFANKRHEGKKTWDFKFSSISSSMKTSLESLRDAVDGDHLKFIYYDGTNYHWVRADGGSFQFSESAYQVYDTNVKLRQQIG